ncbi:MAG: phosphopantetheine-binding protein [Deltaproteobacteria bacterium]|nr:MAG: phosphopantetheine-binding protein [Deltaproteobacteria bacterium]
MDEQTIFEAIRRNVLALVPEIPAEQIALDCTLSDLGLNSIDRAEVIVLVMEQLAVSVPVHEFHRGNTIATLVEVIRRYT